MRGKCFALQPRDYISDYVVFTMRGIATLGAVVHQCVMEEK